MYRYKIIYDNRVEFCSDVVYNTYKEAELNALEHLDAWNNINNLYGGIEIFKVK